MNLGDFISFESISNWNTSKKLTMEGVRYNGEIKAGNEALDRIEAPILEMNIKLSKMKLKQYKPRKIYVAGNHEERVQRYAQENPQLDGLMSVPNNLSLARRGWSYIPYKGMVELQGILFTHAPIMGNGQPVCGINVIGSALRICSKPTVWGHHHYVATSSIKRHGSDDLIQGLTCGCFFEEAGDYMLGGNNNHFKGVVMLDIFRPGRFDFQTISMERIYEL